MTIGVSVGGGNLGFRGRVLGGWHCRSCEKVPKFPGTGGFLGLKYSYPLTLSLLSVA